jgi:1-acyl-sn-glycerol-3-phosphate acyltransferase
METFGVIGAGLLWIVGRGHNKQSNYRLQAWWTRGVIGALKATVGLRIEVEGAPAVGGGPFIALCRHASLADSIMSAWVFVTHSALRPRYVLKQELKMDPCLDIVGHRLPNYFVDRQSNNVSSELQGIEQMARGLDQGDVAVIFPEGTRANPIKRASALESLSKRSPERAQRLSQLKYLLPPKPAGASALLAAVPHATVLTMWHSGFDGMDTFKGIVRQLAKSAVKVHVRVVEHHRSTVASGEAFVAWLDQQWTLMDESVARHLGEVDVNFHNGGNHG